MQNKINYKYFKRIRTSPNRSSNLLIGIIKKAECKYKYLVKNLMAPNPFFTLLT